MLDARGVDRSGVEIQSARPTRDIYVVRSESGDREFAGFGRPTADYADAHMDASKLPQSVLSQCQVLVTGTLGLAQPGTREAIEQSVSIVKQAAHSPIVLVDVNWRPVFWEDVGKAKGIIAEYVQRAADIVKITDMEAQWLFGIDPVKALKEPACVLDKLPNAKGVLVTAGEHGAA